MNKKFDLQIFASTGAKTTQFNCVNYVGELFMIEPKRAAFLSLIGGLQSGGQTVDSWQYAVAQPWALDAPSQPDITEDAAATGASATTYARGQDTNVCQIYQEAVEVTYSKMSDRGTLSGIPILGNQPVTNELDWQIAQHLKQIAQDANYTFINGTHNVSVASDDAHTTRGLANAISTTTVAASNAEWSKSLLEQLIRTMAGNGAVFQTPVLLVGALDLQRTTAAYGYAPEDRKVGGVSVQTIIADIAGAINVLYEPNMPSGTVMLVDAAVCVPVFLPVPGKGHLFYEPLSKTGAAEKGHLYGQIGFTYGPEEYHGMVTGVKTT